MHSTKYQFKHLLDILVMLTLLPVPGLVLQADSEPEGSEHADRHESSVTVQRVNPVESAPRCSSDSPTWECVEHQRRYGTQVALLLLHTGDDTDADMDVLSSKAQVSGG